MFSGTLSINLDAKGRMAMPARIRERLREVCQGQLVVTLGTQFSCLHLYPQPVWDVQQQRIIGLDDSEPENLRKKYLQVGHAASLEMDSANRILLPQNLRDRASLVKQVSLVGQGDRLEIWDQGTWDRQVDRWLNLPAEEPAPPAAPRDE